MSIVMGAATVLRAWTAGAADASADDLIRSADCRCWIYINRLLFELLPFAIRKRVWLELDSAWALSSSIMIYHRITGITDVLDIMMGWCKQTVVLKSDWSIFSCNCASCAIHWRLHGVFSFINEISNYNVRWSGRFCFASPAGPAGEVANVSVDHTPIGPCKVTI